MLLKRAYEILDAGMAPGRVARWFEMHLADELGVRPEVDRCVECGRLLEADERYRWVPPLGGVLCERCPGPPYERVGLSLDGLKLLKAYQRLDVEALAALRIRAERRARGRDRDARVPGLLARSHAALARLPRRGPRRRRVMDPLMLVLRFFHIVAGAAWFGSAFLLTRYVGPSASELGPAAGPMMTAIFAKRRFARVIAVLAVTTVIAGWLMWWHDSQLYESIGAWVGSRFGLVLTIGGVLATIAAYTGITGIGANIDRLVDLGNQVAASGGPPTPEQAARLARLDAEITRNGRIDIILLVLAVTAMATARYW